MARSTRSLLALSTAPLPRGWLRVLSLLGVLAGPGDAATAAAADPETAAEFKEAGRDGPLLVFKRQLPQKVAPIVRITTQVPDLTPAQLFATAWDVPTQLAWVPRLGRLTILKAAENEWVIYEQVKIPVAKDRDYVLRLRAVARGQGGRYEIKAEPPPPQDVSQPIDPGHIRMTDLWSQWIFTATPAGGTALSYESYGDPAGDLPAWLKKSAAVRGPSDFVKALIAETRRRAAR